MNIAYGSVQDILVNDFGSRRVSAMLMSKDLKIKQNRDRVEVAKDIICEAESDLTFNKVIITGDKANR